MKKEDLSNAEIYAREYYLYQPITNINQHLYEIGKEIHESLQPEPWKPKALDKGYIFDVDRVSFVHGDVEDIGEPFLSRQAPTRELAEGRLLNCQIQDTINAWVIENRDESKDCYYFVGYNGSDYHGVRRWSLMNSRELSSINSEMCDLKNIKKLAELLNAGLIHGVPAKMENNNA